METITLAHLTDAVNERETENRALAYEAACEGMVLLKNDGALPFAHKTVALYGAGAKHTIKGGTGSGEVNERHSVTVWEGLVDRGFTITTNTWLEAYDGVFAQAYADYRKEKLQRLMQLKAGSIMDMLWDNYRLPAGPALTEKTDTDQCVYVLSRQAGEGGDRRAEAGDYYVTEEEKAAIRFCAAHYEKFVLIINCGSAMDLGFTEEISGINAILYICQPGTEGGHAVADVLSGVVNPSGKLTDTWAKQYADIPFAEEYSHRNGNLQDEYYKEGIYVGYRYFDSFDVEPRYAFGFGLSYTDFAIECTDVQVQGREVALLAKVTNIGACAGKEVTQLYLSAPAGQLHKEYQQLAVFQKSLLLQPGETENQILRFDLGQFASFREADHCFVLEQGDYVLRLGNSSRNTQVVGVVHLPETVIVSKHTEICPLRQPLEELAAPARKMDLPADLPHLTMDPTAFKTETYDYKEPGICRDVRVRKILSRLTVPEMAEIVVGVGQFMAPHRFHLPGTVGDTTSRFWDKGLVNTPLCDGPAGLRIQKLSTMDKNGRIKPVEYAMSVMEYIPDMAKKVLLGDPKKEVPLYQYTTAFPVANCLAQSWNTALLEQVGGGIQREMEEFGCVYWLAPAMNIHRNPLCGRNFEYLSEDPLLTGALASAITRGVQQKDGYYVTIKHFACNNQEDNRTHVSSNLSQRALREIYLKGFRMAVQAGAKSVMTSYNRVNGVYTPNSHDLCTKVLRCEWGFRGVVMTDWYSTNPGQASNALCMAAGNDLIMPGGTMAKAAIIAAVASGKISKFQLRRCCSNVIKATLESNVQKRFMK